MRPTFRWLSVALTLVTWAGCIEPLDEPGGSPPAPARPAAVAQPIEAAGAVAQPDVDAMIFNVAGCDPPSNAQSCTPRGACCDTHDACIDDPAQPCPPPYTDLRNCTPRAILSGACPAACVACHAAAAACFARCTPTPPEEGQEPTPLPAECQEAACCETETCGDEQACYDRTVNPPELITDPCECGRLNIPLTDAATRPEEHCCAATGWGCCAGVDQAPGAGNGGCCAPAWEEDGVCVFRCMGGPPVVFNMLHTALARAAFCDVAPTDELPLPPTSPTPLPPTSPTPTPTPTPPTPVPPTPTPWF